MKFSDLFVPRYQHSNPDVRVKAVKRIKDPKLLDQIAKQDPDPKVRDVASSRLSNLKVQTTA